MVGIRITSLVFFGIWLAMMTPSIAAEETTASPRGLIARQLSLLTPAFASRQLMTILDIITDVALLTVLGIPVLLLMTAGATLLSPLMGLGGAGTAATAAGAGTAAATGAAAAAAGRKKRGILDRAQGAFSYARNLFDVMANLDAAFQEYDVKGSECQFRAICEIHRDSPRQELGAFSDKITDLIRMQKDLEHREMIPFAKIIFGQYSDAAQYGTEKNDCASIYSRCKKSIYDFAREKKKADENSI